MTSDFISKQGLKFGRTLEKTTIEVLMQDTKTKEFPEFHRSKFYLDKSTMLRPLSIYVLVSQVIPQYSNHVEYNEMLDQGKLTPE
jgi:hypothetical protein